MFNNLGNKLAKMAQRYLRPNKTGGGNSMQMPAAWGVNYRQLPFLSFQMIEQVAKDPMVILGLGMRNAPVADAELAYKDGDKYTYGVKADNTAVGEFVIKQTERFWANDLHKVLYSQVHGWMGAEVVYRLKDGEVEYDTLLEKHAMNVRAMESDGQFWGVKFTNTGHSQPPMLPAGESFWHGFRAQFGQHYGSTVLRGAYPAWCDKQLNGGALDVRKLYMHKYAYGGAVIGYPKGSMVIEGKGTIPNSDIAQQMGEQEKAGALITKPNDFDANGNPLWTFDWRTTGPVPTHIFDFPKDLDREILRGMEIPDEIIMSGGAGSWEGKKVPLQAFYTQMNIWGSAILSDFDRQILRNLVLLRFGKAFDFDIQLKPFSVQLAENENEGDGKKEEPLDLERFGGASVWGPPKQSLTAQRPRQPTALSLDHVAEMHAAEYEGQAAAIVEATHRAIERRTLSLDSGSHEFSSTQFNIPDELADAIRALGKSIPDDDLADDGREENPHVTVKFGLHTNDADDVRRAIRGTEKVSIRIGAASIFKGAEYDVVKLDVDSPDLHALNQIISNALQCTDTHPTYCPHVTIAYVKPGLGAAYAKALGGLGGTEAEFSELIFSDKERNHTAIELVGK